MDIVTLEDGVEIGLRQRAPSDDPIIFAPWCHHIRRIEPFGSFGPQEFGDHKRLVLERLVDAHGVLVACHKDYEQVVHGWACSDAPNQALHFVYVKSSFRGLGIARCLLSLSPWLRYYTHQSRMAPSFAKRFGLVYNPYRVNV